MRAARTAVKAETPEPDAGWLCKLYSENVTLRIIAAAAYWNVPPEKVAVRNVGDQSVLLQPFGRVIAAIGDGLAELREGAR